MVNGIVPTQVGHDFGGYRPEPANAGHHSPELASATACVTLSEDEDDITAAMRPTEPQRRYLHRGLTEPGGKLPLFDRDGREVPARTVRACIEHGWAEPWFHNPLKPDWLVCRLTPKGYAILGRTPLGTGPAKAT
jgi:hypothetical protein